MTPAEEDRALALAQALADFERLMASWADAPEPAAGGRTNCSQHDTQEPATARVPAETRA